MFYDYGALCSLLIIVLYNNFVKPRFPLVHEEIEIQNDVVIYRKTDRAQEEKRRECIHLGFICVSGGHETPLR